MNQQYKPLILKPAKERAVLNRHPWIFSGAIAKVPLGVVSGDIVVVKDHSGKALALGHWCQTEGLCCRIFSFDTDVKIDSHFWTKRFLRAQEMRAHLGFFKPCTNAFRLIHGEGDGLPGLVVDVFNETASIQCSNPGLSAVVPLLVDFLKNDGKKNIHFEDLSQGECQWLTGRGEDFEFLENDLSFFANVGDGQKTGHFLDQRDNRLLVKRLCQKRDVLDAFCYSGGFSVYALAGAARQVTSVDISKTAIALCEKNVAKNGFKDRHRTVVADCFDYLRTIKKDEFDCIILDPPAFAKSAAAVMRAARGYKDINLLAMKAVRENGLIFTFSCSQHVDMELFKKIILASAKDSERDIKVIAELHQGFDHPVSIYCPQSSYLKGLALYVG